MIRPGFRSVYVGVVAAASCWVALLPLQDFSLVDPDVQSYIRDGWRPSWTMSAYWALATLSLMAATRWPAWSISAYVLVEHSVARYSPELACLYVCHIPEIVSVLGFIGVILFHRSAPQRWPSAGVALLSMVAALTLWSLISTAAAVARQGHIGFEFRHHPLRYVDALLLCGSAALGVRRRGDFHLFAGSLAAAVTWRSIHAPDSLPLDGDAAALAAISAMLLAAPTLTAAPRVARLGFALGLVNFVRLVVAIKSRGGAVGLAAGVLALWGQAFHRLKILLVSIPLLAIAAAGLANSGLVERIKGSLPGGSTYDSVESRFALWRAARAMMREHWLVGVGPGNYAHHIEAYQGDLSGFATHNNFLAIGAELGAPGLLMYTVLFVAAISIAWISGRKSQRAWPGPEGRSLAAALIAYLAAGMFISRHDQALPYILIGIVASFAAIPRAGRDPSRAAC
jgi:O-antigen ligase